MVFDGTITWKLVSTGPVESTRQTLKYKVYSVFNLLEFIIFHFRHLFTMHRTLAGSKAVLVNENGEIDVEETSVYVSHFTPSRQNSAFGELLGQYRYNLNEYLRRAIHPGHKIKNWFILPDPVPLTLRY